MGKRHVWHVLPGEPALWGHQRPGARVGTPQIPHWRRWSQGWSQHFASSAFSILAPKGLSVPKHPAHRGALSSQSSPVQLSLSPVGLGFLRDPDQNRAFPREQWAACANPTMPGVAPPAVSPAGSGQGSPGYGKGKNFGEEPRNLCFATTASWEAPLVVFLACCEAKIQAECRDTLLALIRSHHPEPHWLPPLTLGFFLFFCRAAPKQRSQQMQQPRQRAGWTPAVKPWTWTR